MLKCIVLSGYLKTTLPDQDSAPDCEDWLSNVADTLHSQDVTIKTETGDSCVSNFGEQLSTCILSGSTLLRQVMREATL